MGHSGIRDERPSRAPQPCPDPSPTGYPGFPAQAHRRQGHPAPPPGMYGVQCRLRRWPDGRAPSPGQRGHSGSADAHARCPQHPQPRQRRPHHRSFAGHGARSVLHHQAPQGRQRRGPRVLRSRRSRNSIQRRQNHPSRAHQRDGRRCRRSG